jgi:hypothetical protein
LAILAFLGGLGVKPSDPGPARNPPLCAKTAKCRQDRQEVFAAKKPRFLDEDFRFPENDEELRAGGNSTRPQLLPIKRRSLELAPMCESVDPEGRHCQSWTSLEEQAIRAAKGRGNDAAFGLLAILAFLGGLGVKPSGPVAAPRAETIGAPARIGLTPSHGFHRKAPA